MVGPGEESCGLWCGHACCIVGGRAWGGVMLAVVWTSCCIVGGLGRSHVGCGVGMPAV